MDRRDHTGGADVTPSCPQCGERMAMVVEALQWACTGCLLRVDDEVLRATTVADELDVEVNGRTVWVKRRPRRQVGKYYGYPLFEDPSLAPGEIRAGIDHGPGGPVFAISVADTDAMLHDTDAGRLPFSVETQIRKTLENYRRQGALSPTARKRLDPGKRVSEEELMDQFQEMVNAALLRSAARLLPPPEFREAAERQAAKLGMRIEWKQDSGPQRVRTGEGRAWASVDTAADAVERSWATIHTRRGDFDVEPSPENPWWKLLAEYGIDVQEREGNDG